jgi:predicted nucleic acid-binding protein
MSVDFLDTNVLVYSFDDSEPAKRARARELIATALTDRNATISYQVVQEFLNVATGAFASPMNRDQAATYLRDVLMPLSSVWPSRSLFALALDIQLETGYGFYDSLIVAGAVEAGCGRLLTHPPGPGTTVPGRHTTAPGLEPGREVRGVRIVDPFSE